MGAGDWIDQNLFGNYNGYLTNPAPAFNFVLEVEVGYFFPLKSVRAFSKENEYEYIREGGVNDYVHMKRKPISKPFTLQIERYVGCEAMETKDDKSKDYTGADHWIDPLANGTELFAPLLLYVYRYQPRTGIFSPGEAWPVRIYTFTGCTVMSKEYGELNAEKSGLLTETTTIAYRELLVITNPTTSMTEKEPFSAKSIYDDNTKETYVYQKNGDSISRKDTSQFNRPQYQMKIDKNVPKNVERAPYDVEGKSFYDTSYGDAGIPSVKKNSKDTSSMNRAPWDGSNGAEIKNAKENKGGPSPFAADAWDGSKGAKVSRAAEASSDKAGATNYKTDANGNIARKDSSEFNRPQYQLKRDKDNVKYAAQAPVDKDHASAIYKNEGGTDGAPHLSRIDKVDVNKKSWNGEKGADVAWAKQAANDKTNDTYLVLGGAVDRVDSSEFNRKPYDITEKDTKARYAANSPKDTPLQTPVTWPPTRRALMAEQLSKK